MGGWWVAARSLPEMAEYRQKMKLPPSLSKNEPSKRPAYQVLLYVLLHCCAAVCSKCLVGGWVGGARRRPWWVGGPFRTVDTPKLGKVY